MDGIRMEDTSALEAKKLLSRKSTRFMNAFLNQCASDKLMSEYKPVLLNELKEASFEAMRNFQKREGGNIESITKDFISRCENKLLPMSDFDWLDKQNIRQCNFVWFYLFKEGLRHYKSLNNFKNDKKKYMEIISWIDNISGLAINKIKLMDKIKIRWEEATAYRNANYDFLDVRKSNQCKEAIDFLQKPIGNRSKQQYQKPTVITGHEISSDYYRFLLSIDWWDAPSDSKEYFHNKIKDASRKWNKDTKITKVKLGRSPSEKPKGTYNVMENSTSSISIKSKQDTLTPQEETKKEKVLDLISENKKLTNGEGKEIIIRRRKLK